MKLSQLFVFKFIHVGSKDGAWTTLLWENLYKLDKV